MNSCNHCQKETDVLTFGMYGGPLCDECIELPYNERWNKIKNSNLPAVKVKPKERCWRCDRCDKVTTFLIANMGVSLCDQCDKLPFNEKMNPIPDGKAIVDAETDSSKITRDMWGEEDEAKLSDFMGLGFCATPYKNNIEDAEFEEVYGYNEENEHMIDVAAELDKIENRRREQQNSIITMNRYIDNLKKNSNYNKKEEEDGDKYVFDEDIDKDTPPFTPDDNGNHWEGWD